MHRKMQIEFPCSSIETITIEKESDWNKLAIKCYDITLPAINFFRNGLHGIVKTILVEPFYICKDYRNLYSQFFSKKFIERSSYCSRVHFFSEKGLTEQDIVYYPEIYQESYIGYSVIQPIEKKCIGRTVIDPFKLRYTESNFYCLRTKFKVNINGAEYFVTGYPYSSQNAEASVCAHTALWCACRYLSERYSVYKDFFPYDLIDLAENSEGRKVPYRGMTYKDYSNILLNFGTFPAILRKRNSAFYYDFYSYIESGFPVLVSFEGHVINIIGHTLFNKLPSDATCNHYGFYDSLSLVDKYIAVDDNFFPYQMLGNKTDIDNYGTIYGDKIDISVENIKTAVIPLPEKVYLPPQDARKFCYAWYDENNITALLKELKVVSKPDKEKVICRLFLTSAKSFKKRKRDLSINIETGIEKDVVSLVFPVDISLPHFIWVMEISIISEYLRGKCLGEVILDASSNKHAIKMVYARLGKEVYYQNKNISFSNNDIFYSQYTHNLGER